MNPEFVLDFWFGKLDSFGRASPEQRKKWFQKNPQFDEEIKSLFISTYHQAMEGEFQSWLDQPRSRLAYVLILDQFSRNMFRGKPEMFSADPITMDIVHSGLRSAMDEKLFLDGRVFFYMPLMHSEKIRDQEECIRRFEELREELPMEIHSHVDSNLEFAMKHWEVINRFSRFPHRNEILCRQSTPEELQFLKSPGSRF